MRTLFALLFFLGLAGSSSAGVTVDLPGPDIRTDWATSEPPDPEQTDRCEATAFIEYIQIGSDGVPFGEIITDEMNFNSAVDLDKCLAMIQKALPEIGQEYRRLAEEGTPSNQLNVRVEQIRVQLDYSSE